MNGKLLVIGYTLALGLAFGGAAFYPSCWTVPVALALFVGWQWLVGEILRVGEKEKGESE